MIVYMMKDRRLERIKQEEAIFLHWSRLATGLGRGERRMEKRGVERVGSQEAKKEAKKEATNERKPRVLPHFFLKKHFQKKNKKETKKAAFVFPFSPTLIPQNNSSLQPPETLPPAVEKILSRPPPSPASFSDPVSIHFLSLPPVFISHNSAFIQRRKLNHRGSFEQPLAAESQRRSLSFLSLSPSEQQQQVLGVRDLLSVLVLRSKGYGPGWSSVKFIALRKCNDLEAQMVEYENLNVEYPTLKAENKTRKIENAVLKGECR